MVTEKNIATIQELEELEQACKSEAKEARKNSLQSYQAPIKAKQKELLGLFPALIKSCANAPGLQILQSSLNKTELTYKDVLSTTVEKPYVYRRPISSPERNLKQWVTALQSDLKPKMSSHYTANPTTS